MMSFTEAKYFTSSDTDGKGGLKGSFVIFKIEIVLITISLVGRQVGGRLGSL